MGLLILIILLLTTTSLHAQDMERYNRASIYPLYLLHPQARMADELFATTYNIAVPDKYNDHRLSLRSLQGLSLKAKDDEVQAAATKFLQDNQIAKRMVSKWFLRDRKTGAFRTDLIADRAAYNTSAREQLEALYTVEGVPVPHDADRELIANTFVIINDISYIDKEEKAQMAGAVFFMIGTAAELAGGAAGMAGNSNAASIANMTQSFSQLSDAITNMVAGFQVDITSYLYQLNWTDSVANQFYLHYYFDSLHLNPDRKRAYEKDDQLFTLNYIGKFTARSDKTVMRGVNNPSEVYLKVLNRALDKNIVELQRKYPAFKVTDILYSITPDNQVQVQIGLKEGVTPKSKYEVLERVIGKDLQIHYERRATIQPVADLIWDNRYMAREEQATNADLNATTFTVLTGNPNNLYQGMLIRELK